MKLLFTLFLFLLFPLSASAMQGKECAQRAEQVADSKRESFIAECLKRAQSPANIKAESRSKRQKRCEQNSKNMQLKGNEKRNYFNACMERNEAAIASKRKPDNVIPLSDIPFLNDDKPNKRSARKNSDKKKGASTQPRIENFSAEESISDITSRK